MDKKVDIEELMKEYDEKVGADPHVDAVVVLFPYLLELKDTDVKDFYKAVSERGYRGGTFNTVEEVKHFAETYRIINRCVQEEFIAF